MAKENNGYSFLPDKGYLLEMLRPWKLVTFSAGMAWLIYGALVYHISDWDIGISLIMGGLAYIFAPWTIHTIVTAIRMRPDRWPWHVLGALLPAIFTIDWSYWLYHTALGNEMIRWENFKTSSLFYFICGLFWYYRGSLRDLMTGLKKHP